MSLDAAVCILAGGDFLAGRAPGPKDQALAEYIAALRKARSAYNPYITVDYLEQVARSLYAGAAALPR